MITDIILFPFKSVLTMISFKSCVLVATSVITIPYILAITCNIMYGSPLSKNRYLSLLHPRKVCCLLYQNQVILKLNVVRD